MHAFNGRGPQGPEMCITDDCAAERAAIHSTYGPRLNYFYVSSTTSKVGGPGCGMGSRELPRMTDQYS